MEDKEINQMQAVSENADLEYIIELFDSKELGLTIAEDTEENERSSKIFSNK